MGGLPLGSLSIDLDDEWAYRRSLGDPGWRERSSYFSSLGPRLTELLEGRQATCFAVGADARRDTGASLLAALFEQGHEIGCHSDAHDLRLHRRGRVVIEADLERAGAAIAAVTGVRPDGFRSPGYGMSPDLRAALAGGDYRYDASPFPSPLSAISRVWFGRHYPGARPHPRNLGSVVAELRMARPRTVYVDGRRLVELPVTVMPYTRLPIHASYLLLLGRRVPRLALGYLERALRLCERCGIGPALVLHPTDLLDAGDSPALSRFPGMEMPAAAKAAFVRRWLAAVEDRFVLGTTGAHAAAAAAS